MDAGDAVTQALRAKRPEDGTAQAPAAEAGLGIALTLEDSVRFYEGDARLERPFGESVATPYSYWWVSRKPGASDVALRRFRDWLQAESAVRPEVGALAATA